MSMIARYKKSGGFVQLLQLIETSGKQKQERFLEIIRGEDSAWADAIESKMLTFERIIDWNDETLAEIFSTIKDINLAMCIHILSEDQWAKITKTFSHARIRKIDDLKTDKEPTAAEKTTAMLSIITETRQMVSDGYIRLEKVDPELAIEDDIEESLENKAPASGELHFGGFEAAGLEAKLASASAKGMDLDDIRGEVNQLKKKLMSLGDDNKKLRSENEAMKNKLEKIKQIA